MTFLNPGFVWAFAVLLPLTAVYFFKVKPRRQVTTAWFLWDEVFKEQDSHSLFRKLRDLFSLLLLLLACCAICLAMMQPIYHGSHDRSKVILIIDNSASMNAIAGGNSLFVQAQKEAIRAIKDLPMGTKAMLVTASRQLNYVNFFTNDHQRLVEAVENLKPSQVPLNESTLGDFLQERAKLNDCQVVFISDGQLNEIRDLKSVNLINVGGEHLDNIGIVACDIRRVPGDEAPVAIFLQFYSSYRAAQTLTLNVALNKKESIVRVRELTIEPGLNKPTMFHVPNGQAGTWLTFFELNDALSLDNEAVALVPEIKEYSVQIVADQNSFFYANAAASFHSHQARLRITTDKAPIVISLGQPPATDSAETLQIVFSPKGKSLYWEQTGTAVDETSQAVICLESHPVIKFSQLDTVRFKGKAAIKAPKSATVIMRDQDNLPLLYKFGMTYVINMDPEASHFFLTPDFPILIHSIIEDGLGADPNLVSCHSTGEVVCGTCMEQIGVRSVNDSTGTAKAVAVNLINRGESALDALNTAETAGVAVNLGKPLAGWLIALSLFVVLLESMLYHRRKVG